MDNQFKFALFVAFYLVLAPPTSNIFAGHPLVTDDTGTQGAGGIQLEINGNLGYHFNGKTRERANQFVAVFSYGLAEDVDILAGIPYGAVAIHTNGHSVRHHGLSDVSLELKWRFWDINGVSAAVKPGLMLPTGSYAKGLGAGRTTYGSMFILTGKLAPCSFHANVGYRRNENRLSEKKDIWHVSLAAESQIVDKLRLVAELGADRNSDKRSATPPAFFTGGLVYAVGKNTDINFGIQFGLSKTEADYVFRPGLVHRFNFE